MWQLRSLGSSLSLAKTGGVMSARLHEFKSGGVTILVCIQRRRVVRLLCTMAR